MKSLVPALTVTGRSPSTGFVRPQPVLGIAGSFPAPPSGVSGVPESPASAPASLPDFPPASLPGAAPESVPGLVPPSFPPEPPVLPEDPPPSSPQPPTKTAAHAAMTVKRRVQLRISGVYPLRHPAGDGTVN